MSLTCFEHPSVQPQEDLCMQLCCISFMHPYKQSGRWQIFLRMNTWMFIQLYIQQDAALHNLFISWNCSTCFGWYLHQSSGAHTTVFTASGTLSNRYCYLSLSWKRPNCSAVPSLWQVPDAVNTVVCAPDDGWRYRPKHVEQFPEINKLCNVAYCWIYNWIYLRCMDPER